jgi:hypothetical protein
VRLFTGRLSIDGELITDQASGEIQELRTPSGLGWVGTIQFPKTLSKVVLLTSTLRLECSDGLAILIDLDQMTVSYDGQQVRSMFRSHGLFFN